MKEYIVGFIPVLKPFGTQKVLLSMDAGLVARIDRVAKNRSAFLASAAEYMLGNPDYRERTGARRNSINLGKKSGK
jgi:hypothetical protein